MSFGKTGLVEKAKQYLFARQTAYRAVFPMDAPQVEKVLKDLAAFCRANQTTFNPDPRANAVLEGRREVWLRIQHHLKLTQEQIWNLYGRD